MTPLLWVGLGVIVGGGAVAYIVKRPQSTRSVAASAGDAMIRRLALSLLAACYSEPKEK